MGVEHLVLEPDVSLDILELNLHSVHLAGHVGQAVPHREADALDVLAVGVHRGQLRVQVVKPGRKRKKNAFDWS